MPFIRNIYTKDMDGYTDDTDASQMDFAFLKALFDIRPGDSVVVCGHRAA